MPSETHDTFAASGVSTVTELSAPDWELVGLIDAVAGGWFRNDTGELIAGLPILPSDIVLDVGCGDGGNVYFCGQQGAHVAFTDIEPARVAETERRARSSRARGVEPIVSDCDPIPLPDGYANVVICTEVLEHVPDPKRLVAELVRVGAPGARYLISVPDPVSETVQRKLADESFFRAPNHLRVFARDDFARLLLGDGLLIEKIQGYGFFWSVWWAFYWSCEAAGTGRQHPALVQWSRAWIAMLDSPDGPRIKEALDALAPKSQLVLARKPTAGKQAGIQAYSTSSAGDAASAFND